MSMRYLQSLFKDSSGKVITSRIENNFVAWDSWLATKEIEAIHHVQGRSSQFHIHMIQITRTIM